MRLNFALLLLPLFALGCPSGGKAAKTTSAKTPAATPGKTAAETPVASKPDEAVKKAKVTYFAFKG